MSLHLVTYQREPWTVIAISGDLDLVTSPVLLRHLKGHASHAKGRVVADLSGVEFIDARGLSALLAADRAARGLGGGLRLAAASPRVRKLLTITGLHNWFPGFPTVEAATTAPAKPRSRLRAPHPRTAASPSCGLPLGR